MPLSAGDRLGPYEILGPIGSGGMGDVYRARDTRLGREVALKLLHAGKASSPERAARFMQEARTASALNHPNIITIHDIGVEGGLDFIVMEYIKGRSLDQLIPSAGLPVSQTLRLAVQIADALSRAHAAGIIHRDLKPANIMVTEDGQVKVLDFGLAKLTDRNEISDLDATLTVQRANTEEGAVVGTPSYMSPEQTEGRKLDPRSDIFSFGAVMYEMVTGRRAFSGASQASTIAAILREDPKPAREAVHGVPPEFDRIIARCLRKDPARRFQHMDDLKVALEELKEESDSGKLSVAAPGPIAPVKTSRRVWAILGASCLILVVAGALFLRGRNATPLHVHGLTPVRITSDSGLTTDPALWGPGNLVAYASDRAADNLDIWVQQLQTGETRRLTTNPADDHEPDFSPDGSTIVFRSERGSGGIYQISVIGGTEKKIADRGHNPKFSPDGNWIAYWIGEPTLRSSASGRLMVMQARGAEAREVMAGQASGIEPVWAPDSKRLLFFGWKDRKNPDAYVAPLEGGEPVATGMLNLLESHHLASATTISGPFSDLSVGAWSGDRIILSAPTGDSQNLWRATLDPRTYQVTGQLERLTSGASMDSHAEVSGARMVFASMVENSDVWYLPLNTDTAKVTGEPHRVTTALTQEVAPAVSADGTRIVYGSVRGESSDFVLHDLSMGRPSVIASGRAAQPGPRISADGSKISYTTYEGGKPRVFVMPSAGGVPQMVCDDCMLRAWAHDGKRLLVSHLAGPGLQSDLGLLDTGARRYQALLHGQAAAPRTLLDDRWLTFYSLSQDDPGHSHIFILPVHASGETPKGEWIAVTDGSAFDALPEFSPNGNLLYFQSLRDGSRCLWAIRLDPATKRPQGAPFPVFHFHGTRQSLTYVKLGTGSNAVARDKIVYTSVERTGNIWMLTEDH